MSTHRSRLLTPGTLFLWGVVILYFCMSGRIASYLHPSFQGFCFAAGVVLSLLGVGALVVPMNHCSECDAHDHHSLGVCSLAVLVVPLLVTTLLSQDHFGASTVLNRGIVGHIEDLPAFLPPIDPALPRDDGSVAEGTMMDPALYLQTNAEGHILAETVDLMYAASDAAMREDFNGRMVEVIGQLMPARTSNPGDNRFQLVRLFVMCCAADARPAGITIETNVPVDLSDNSWVKVIGRATFPVENGRHIAVLHADRIIKTDPPRDSFIY